MNEPVWKLVYNCITQQTDVVWRRWPDGREDSRSVKDPEYCRWLAEGNTPEPADELVFESASQPAQGAQA